MKMIKCMNYEELKTLKLKKNQATTNQDRRIILYIRGNNRLVRVHIYIKSIKY